MKDDIGPVGLKYFTHPLAVADIPGPSQEGDLLLAAVLRAAGEAGMGQLTGKVHARNLGMRTLYRKFGFEVEGTQRAGTFRDGEYVDSLYMARLRPGRTSCWCRNWPRRAIRRATCC